MGHVLVVCTGNVCRSPYIERVLAHELAGTGISVSSAGTGALVGAPIEKHAAERARAAGASTENYAARQVTREMVAEADLIIAAAREHLGPLVQLYPRALRYAFALRDLGDLLAVAKASDIAAAPGDNHVAKVAATAIAERGIVNPRLPDQSGVIDPFRQSPQVFDQMVEQVNEALPTVIAALRG